MSLSGGKFGETENNCWATSNRLKQLARERDLRENKTISFKNDKEHKN